jgi:hypothetical protein
MFIKTVPKLLLIIASKTHFPWGDKYHNRLFEKMEFVGNKCHLKGKVMIKRAGYEIMFL